jgi:hypothetical protein
LDGGIQSPNFRYPDSDKTKLSKHENLMIKLTVIQVWIWLSHPDSDLDMVRIRMGDGWTPRPNTKS